MFRFRTHGNYNKIKKELKIKKDIDTTYLLNKYGRIGVERLASATPVRTGLTRDSWKYTVTDTKKGQKLIFYNTNRGTDTETSVVILLIHGHVTREGGWIEGNDFVSPIIDDICEEIKTEL